MSRDSLSGDDAAVGRYADSATAFRGLPGDLIVVVIYTVLVGGAIATDSLPSVFRFVVGVPFLLFVPGYSLLAALFPGRPSRNAGRVSSLSGMSRRFSSMRSIQQRGVRWGERAALSFGLSMFLVPLLALVLDFAALVLATGPLFRTGPIVTILAAFSLGFTFVGTVRRLRLPRAQRFAVPVGYWIEDFLDGLSGSPVDALLNVVLVLSVLVGAASLTYALAVPQSGESYTGLRLGTQDGSGQFVENPPTNFTVGESRPLTVNIRNEEQRSSGYTVVVQLQRRNDAGGIVARDELDRFSTGTVPANRTWQRQHSVSPTAAGENLQLVYLLYRGEPPADPTERNAYRAAYLSVDVAGGGAGGDGDGGGGGGG